MIDAFPYESAPKYLLRDRDAIYGDEFTRQIADMGIRASDTFAPNSTGVVNCGFACHTIVAKKDYIFTAYGKR